MIRTVSLVLLAAALLTMSRCGSPQTIDRGVGSAGEELKAGTHQRQIDAAGQRWTYELHIPAKNAGQPRALVLVLHGAGGSGGLYLEKNGWRTKADEEGFVVLAPDGLPARPQRAANFFSNPRLWNSGQLDSRSPRAAIDDLAFFDGLLDEVALLTDIDPARVFVCGHSNGAGMTYRLAAERSKRFAAAAMVNGFCWIEGASAERAIPSLAIHGELDPLVPIAGGESELPWGKRTMPPLRTSLERWSGVLGCTTDAREVSDENRVRTVEYTGCRDQAIFRVLYIADHGHSWPGGSNDRVGRRWQGAASDALNATDAIWSFFEAPTAAR
ncbi:MAG: PHB depolymerase family esterase [Phycisphaerae bacterium]|nr:PHB depolymerase family esterase [Phycisphaerae bacterium]